MNNKYSFAVLICLILVILSVQGTLYLSAEENGSNAGQVFYVSSAGNDAASGSEEQPLKTLTEAIKKLSSKGGVIVIKDLYTMGENVQVYSDVKTYTEPKHQADITITSVYGGKDYRKSGAAVYFPSKFTYECSGNTVFSDITVKSDGEDVYIAACFNKLEFGEGFAAVNSKGAAKFIFAIGGYYAPRSTALPVNGDAFLTIRAGDFKRIFGFAHVRGAGTLTFKGTSRISIYGGNIDMLYGGSGLNHYSGSTDIKVYGGFINTLSTAGDAQRRLLGNASVSLYGGTINSLVINNVIGDTEVLLDQATVKAISVTYATDEIKSAAYGKAVKIKYNSVVYTASFINSISGVTKTEYFGKAYYKAGAAGNGKAENTPAGSLDEVIRLLANGGGDVVLLSDLTLKDYTEPSHKEPIHFVSGGGALTLNGSYTLSGSTFFGDITLKGDAEFFAAYNPLEFESSVKTEGSFSVYGGLNGGVASGKTADITISGGSFKTVCFTGRNETGTGASFCDISINGGRAEKIISSGKSAKLRFEISEGSIGSVSFSSAGNAVAEVSGGSIGKLSFNDISGDIQLSFNNGSVGSVEAAGVSGGKTLKYNPDNIKAEQINAVKAVFDTVTIERVVFIRDGGTGKGYSAESPAGSLIAAYNMLPEGGIIVICGPLTVSNRTPLTLQKGSVTITSVHGDTDYRAAAGAILKFNADAIDFRGEIDITALDISVMKDGGFFYFNGFKAHIGEDVNTSLAPSASKYISLAAGSASVAITVKTSSLTVDSGTWNDLRGGSTGVTSFKDFEYSLTVNGGIFHGKVITAGTGEQQGNATLTVNGGTLYGGVYGFDATTQNFSGTINIILNGGTFYNKITLATSYSVSASGKFNVELNGGDYAHLTDLEGDKKYTGRLTSTLTVAEGYDTTEKVKGDFTYNNPIRETADPRILLVDGVYYYVFTDTSTLHVYKAYNISDLAYSDGVPVWKTSDAAVALQGRTSTIWPCDLKYFSPEDFGEEYAGYYIMFSTVNYYDKNGALKKEGLRDQDRRTYILKCASSDLQGDWINPVTKEKNIPLMFSSDTESWVNNVDWCTGYKNLRYNGKIYALFVEQRDRGTINFRQITYLSELKNPWTVTGKVLKFIEPIYDWEKHVDNGTSLAGTPSAYDEVNDVWYLGVIEGLLAVNGPNNELYVLYVGSGYWTKYYAFGCMTYIGTDGDILNIDNWSRSPQPVFSMNSEVNGTGGPTQTTSPDGKIDYILYHGFLGPNATGGRYAFMEPYTVDAQGVHWGVDGHPSPLSAEFTIPLNETPLFKKISGFDNWTNDFLVQKEAVTLPSGFAESDLQKSLQLSVFGGKQFSADEYGTVSFSYATDGRTFTETAPQTPGEYTVKMTLSGVYSFSGLGGTFTLTVVEAPAESTDNTDNTGSAGSYEAVIITGCVLVVVGAAAAVFAVISKKKKNNR